MNIRKGTKTAGVITDLLAVPSQNTQSLADYGYMGHTPRIADTNERSSTRRVLSQARRAGLVKKDGKGCWSLTAKGRKVAANL